MNLLKLKLSHLSPLLLLAAGMGVFLSCAEDGLPGEGIGTGSNNAQTLIVSVSDGGYAPAESTANATAGGMPQGSHVVASTRAAEDGYRTKFTAGDRIGIFAVKDGAQVSDIENLCLTAADDGSGGIKWGFPAGSTVSLSADASYYAYYPWRSPLTGTLVPGLTPSGTPATDAAAFFANVISAWTPATDQSTYDKYTAQDLMVAKGVVSGTSLSFSMEHQMTLVVIKLPLTVYRFSNTSPAVPDYMIHTHQFSGFSPCPMDDYTFRYLVPRGGASKLSGSYVSAFGTVKWEFTPDHMAAGHCKTYTVDGGVVNEISHLLQSGDFFLKDGSLVSVDVEPSDAQKSACIGVVWWVGDIAATNYGLLDAKFPKGTRGLVTALWDAEDPDHSGSKMMTWTYGESEYINGQLATAGFVVPEGYDFGAIDKNQGYINTLALRQYNNYVGDIDDRRVKPIYALDKFETAHPAPAQSSGWYWPSSKEMANLYVGPMNDDSLHEMLDIQLGKIDGAEVFGSNVFWASTEVYPSSEYAYNFSFSLGYGSADAKGTAPYCVRPILAF